MKTRKLLDYRKLAFNFHFAAFFVLSIVTLIPLAYTFRLSFFDYQLSKPGSLNIFIGLKNYKFLFTDPGLYKSLGITLIYVISSVSL
jgi:multiple sugar transport system permease protein